MYDAVADDYCYPGTTVLKNRLDLRDSDELDAFEAEVSDARADEELPAGDLDFAHFKAVHGHLFQDVYDWAGEFRTVRISKGGNMFCFPENIEAQPQKLFSQLKKNGFLTGLEPDRFAEKAAHFLSELNVIHAFREGNGRTQLSFFLVLADHAGHPIDLDDLDPDAFLKAMIASFDGDEESLAAVIQNLVADQAE
ncbi:Fic family protein [Bradyrhizobium sp. USDA 3256]